MQVMQEVMLLHQLKGEDVLKYGKRAIDISEKYVEALYADRAAKGQELDTDRFEEAQALVREHFTSGLSKFIKSEVREKAKTLPQAVSIAAAAQTSATLQNMVTKYEQADKVTIKDNKPAQGKSNWSSNKNKKIDLSFKIYKGGNRRVCKSADTTRRHRGVGKHNQTDGAKSRSAMLHLGATLENWRNHRKFLNSKPLGLLNV